MQTRTCKCGKTFDVQYPSSKKTNCSATCRVAGRAARSDKGVRKSQWLTVVCNWCGASQEVMPHRANQRYCSVQCTDAAAKGRPAKGRPQMADGHGRYISTTGYAWVYVPPADRPEGWTNSYDQEHRVVMRKTLGRHLLPGENVHHINGNKQDNRPENLELWLTKQPKGQRVDDLVAYAREILALYT